MAVEWKKGVISLVVTLSVCFGGWFIYQKTTVEEPMNQLMEEHPDIRLARLDVQPQSISLEAEFMGGSLASYLDFVASVHAQADGREVMIHLHDDPNPLLTKAWNDMSFGVQEGLEKQTYTKIQQTIEAISKEHDIAHEMILRDNYLSIALRSDNHVLYRVFDLNQERGESR